MMRSRYEATLFDEYLLLLDGNEYRPSATAVSQAREKVVNESIVPIVITLVATGILSQFLDATLFSTIVCVVLGLCSVGDNMAPIARRGHDGGEDNGKHTN